MIIKVIFVYYSIYIHKLFAVLIQFFIPSELFKHIWTSTGIIVPLSKIFCQELELLQMGEVDYSNTHEYRYEWSNEIRFYEGCRTHIWYESQKKLKNRTCYWGARSFPSRFFHCRSFPIRFFPARFFPHRFFPGSSFPFLCFPSHFFKQGTQPSQINPCQTKLRPKLTISNLTQPNPT